MRSVSFHARGTPYTSSVLIPFEMVQLARKESLEASTTTLRLPTIAGAAETEAYSCQYI